MYPGRMNLWLNFYGSEIRHGSFGGLNFGPGIFWRGLIFAAIRSSLSLEIWSTPAPAPTGL